MADAPEDQKVGTADQQEQNPTTKTQTPEVGGDTGGETGQKSGEDEGFDALPQKTQDEIKSLPPRVRAGGRSSARWRRRSPR